MKIRHTLWFFFFSTAVLISCQKSYAPDGLVVGSSGGTTTGGSTGGPLLIKTESKTVGSSEGSTNTYEYDASSRLTRITQVDVDSSNKSTTTVYRYVRDASGKITSIVSNALAVQNAGSGFPDSIYINVNYPAGATAYNFTSYGFSVGGTAVKDSTGYVYNGSNITDVYEYQAVGTPALTVVARLQYIYSGGNVVAQKVYTPSSTGALVLAATYTYEYDTKVSALYTGNDAFLPGQDVGYASKNNPSKFVVTDNSNNSVLVTFNYTLQYNTANVPITGTVIATPGNKTTALKFTYQ